MMTSTLGLAAVLCAEVRASGLTQAQIARAIGCSVKHVNEVLRGRAGCSLDFADSILGAIGRQLVLTTTAIDVEG